MPAVSALIYFATPEVLDRLDALAKELGRKRGEVICVLLTVRTGTSRSCDTR